MALGIGQKTVDVNAFGGTVVSSALNTAASGSTFIVGCTYGAGNFTSLADNKGNTIGAGQLIGAPNVFGADRGRLYVIPNASGGSSHQFTLTSSGSSAVIYVLEITATGSVTVHSSAAIEDTGSPYSSGGLTPSAAETALVSFFYGFTGDNPATNTEGGLTGSTKQLDQTDGANARAGAMATLIVNPASGTYTDSWTQSNYTINAGVFMVALQETATGVSGVLSQTLGNVTLAASGSLTERGALSATLGDVTLSASASVTNRGVLGATLADVTLAATGLSGSASTGSLDVTLQDVTLTATATIPNPIGVRIIQGGLPIERKARKRKEKPVPPPPKQKTPKPAPKPPRAATEPPQPPRPPPRDFTADIARLERDVMASSMTAIEGVLRRIAKR